MVLELVVTTVYVFHTAKYFRNFIKANLIEIPGKTILPEPHIQEELQM